MRGVASRVLADLIAIVEFLCRPHSRPRRIWEQNPLQLGDGLTLSTADSHHPVMVSFGSGDGCESRRLRFRTLGDHCLKISGTYGRLDCAVSQRLFLFRRGNVHGNKNRTRLHESVSNLMHNSPLLRVFRRQDSLAADRAFDFRLFFV